jgi:hypothetical protein
MYGMRKDVPWGKVVFPRMEEEMGLRRRQSEREYVAPRKWGQGKDGF